MATESSRNVEICRETMSNEHYTHKKFIQQNMTQAKKFGLDPTLIYFFCATFYCIKLEFFSIYNYVHKLNIDVNYCNTLPWL